MSEGSEKVKRLVEFKEKLAKKIEMLESDLKEAQAMLETVNSILLEKGFKRVEIAKEPPAASVPAPKEVVAETAVPHGFDVQESEKVTPLRASTGELLAIIYVDGDCLHVLPEESKNFSVNTPPFTHFLVERVLAKMQERDNELVRTGQLKSDRIFSYSIVREDDVIREITVKNVDAERVRELKSSVRWTFEKMFEKMHSQS